MQPFQRLEGSQSGQNDLAAAGEPGEGIGNDGTDANAEIGRQESGVDPQRRVAKINRCGAEISRCVVNADGKAVGDPLTDLVADLVRPGWAMCADRHDDIDRRVRDARG